MSDKLSADLASLRIEAAAPVRAPSKRGFWVATLVVAALLVGGALAAIPYLKAAYFQTEVEVTEVLSLSPATVATEVAASGYVVPQVISRVGTKVTGKIARVEVVEGQSVRQGDLLIALDAADQQSALSAGQARVAAAEADAERQKVQLTDAQRRLKREEHLAAEGVTGRGAVDDLQAEVQTLSQAVSAAQANAAAARADARTLALGIGHLAIRAPINGTILTKPPQLGEVVSPNGGPLLELADFSTLMVEVEVPETRLAKVRRGAPCEIMLDAYAGKRYRGEVREVSPIVNRAKATVVVKVAFVGDATGVLPNMAARAFFLEDDASAAEIGQPPKVVVPSTAVLRRDDAAMVFVIDGGKVRMTPVTLGPAFGSGFELKEGPSVGTKLVKNPPSTLADGQRIRERNPS